MNSYLSFVEIKDTGKTKVYTVLNKDYQDLGIISWRTGWRRHVFSPYNAVFDVSCLNEICNFINVLMEDRKNGSPNR